MIILQKNFTEYCRVGVGRSQLRIHFIAANSLRFSLYIYYVK